MNRAIYTIEYAPGVLKSLAKLPAHIREALVRAIQGLANDRFPRGAEKLTDAGGRYRYRVGAFRIIYECHHDRLLVVVLDVDDRKQVYKR